MTFVVKRFRLPKFQKKERPFLVLDIGTEAVKAFVCIKTNGKITLLGKSVQYIDPFRVWPNLQDSQDNAPDFNLRIIQEFAGKAITEAQRIAQRKAHYFLLGLSPLFLRSRIGTISVERAERLKHISKNEEAEILEKARGDGETVMAQSVAKQYGLEPKDIFFISLKIIGIAIDGYKVYALRNFNGKNIELRYLAAFSPKSYIDKAGLPLVLRYISKSAGRTLRLRGFFHEADYFMNPALSLLFREGIFIDIGGRATNLFILKDGLLLGVYEFEAGGDDFTLKLAQDMGLDKIRARAIKEQYSRGELSKGVSSEIKEKLAAIAQNWLFALKGKLSDVTAPLPNSFFLFGGGALLPDIKNAIEDTDWRGVPLAGAPKVNLLYPRALSGIEDPNGFASNPQDTPPLLLSYFHT